VPKVLHEVELEATLESVRLVVRAYDAGLRESLGDVAVEPVVDCSNIWITFHAELGDEPPAELVPVRPRFLRAMPDVPLVNVAHGRITAVHAAKRTSRVVEHVAVLADNVWEDPLVDVSCWESRLSVV
jgi:hypothetical protein